MANDFVNFTVTDDGEDKGKLFVITKMSAFRIESWSMRALLALMNAGADVPDDFETLGAAGLAELGMKALSGLRWDVLEPLLAEMMECVQVVPTPGKTHVMRGLVESDITEVPTIFALRMEWWSLHMGFLRAVAKSVSAKKQAAAAKQGRVTKTSQS